MDGLKEPSGKVEEIRAGFGSVAAILGNLLILGVVVYAAVLAGSFPDLYYESVQEDETLEWASFWAFFVAAAAFLVAGVRQRRATGRLAWFSMGVGLFCLFVAMEEVSWGQRVLGYRPPEYFLEQNFQQELNAHNVLGTSIRKLTLKGVILGYGVLMPCLAFVPPLRRWFERIGVPTPPWQLAPAFLATYFLYEAYPWSHTGEWVELMLGLGFLFAAVTQARGSQAGALLLVWIVVLSLGFSTAAVSRNARQDKPELLAAAQIEVEALRRDFASGQVNSQCNLHKRLYTFMEKYRQFNLLEGEFSRLTNQGLPEARADFLLDPWNSPYWIRDRCEDGRRVAFVYSFGPNRRRESSRWEILGDDIGAIIREK